MAKLADAPDLGSGGEIHAGSIPVTRTNISLLKRYYAHNGLVELFAGICLLRGNIFLHMKQFYGCVILKEKGREML